MLLDKVDSDFSLKVGKKRVEATKNGHIKTIEKVFKIIKEKNVEVDLEEVGTDGRPLHMDLLQDRTIRRENADQRIYKRILKNCHKSLSNTALNGHCLQSKDLLLQKRIKMAERSNI